MEKNTPINKLDRKEQMVLEDMLNEHASEVKAGKWTKETFAAYASKKMGRPVTVGNVQGACKAMDVAFPMGKNSAALRSTHQLRKAVCVLSGEIARLCGELGVTCSQEVLDIAKGCGSEEE